ncbi:putative sensor domain DACNV-containing protein [uncultured Paludibaculum sp.]|uniref:putative sensor domain DACNV-containing protein n=1 Tax=uncultured Paludibaculum sp. TaxID=1765020 RepID=UPI002AABEBA7|nr:hypothetical protein [uncultured Paludibaculum sp.]
MPESAYPMARVAALRIHERFEQLSTASRAAGSYPGPCADLATLEAAIDVAFWASLRREEGFAPRVSLAFLPPGSTSGPLRLSPPLLLTPQSLTRLAPAVDRQGIHLGVWHEDGTLTAWGATHHLPPFTPVLDVVAPGLLVVKYTRGEESGKFVNIAVIEGDQLKMIDPRATSLPECPSRLTPLLGIEMQFQSEDAPGILLQFAVSMRAHARGGALLLVPSESSSWRESILSPPGYVVSPAYSAVPVIPTPGLPILDELRRKIESAAGLTAVDGATLLNDRFEVLAFGDKIIRRRGASPVSQVTLSEPIEGAQATVVEPALLGGTRHLSAAQFIQDQPDSVAMVASQDGRFTVFWWSQCDGMVHARRVESVLL